MSNHTPGPWVAERMLVPSKAKDRRSGFVVNEVNDTREYGTRICDLRVPRGSMAFMECEANARLIAAAPEMLAALERLLGCPAMNMDDMEVEDDQAFEQAYNLLSRVKGGA